MIIIDQKTIKALASETKLSILKALSEKPKTLSDLAKELRLKPSTLKEHIEKLIEIGLIEKEKTRRKWKYYYLTRKGKNIVKPEGKTFTLMLFSNIILSMIFFLKFLRDFIATIGMASKATPLVVSRASTINKTLSNNTVSHTLGYLSPRIKNVSLNASITSLDVKSSSVFHIINSRYLSLILSIIFFSISLIMYFYKRHKYIEYKNKVIN